MGLAAWTGLNTLLVRQAGAERLGVYEVELPLEKTDRFSLVNEQLKVNGTSLLLAFSQWM